MAQFCSAHLLEWSASYLIQTGRSMMRDCSLDDARRVARNPLLARLIRIAGDHGFDCWPLSDGIAVAIPYTTRGAERGYMVPTARTVRELRIVLGY